MFESIIRGAALTMFLASALFLTLVAGAFGALLGAGAGWASIALLHILTPATFAAHPERWELVFGTCSGFLGTVGGWFLLGRFCWREAKSSDDAQLQAWARRVEALWKFGNRRL